MESATDQVASSSTTNNSLVDQQRNGTSHSQTLNNLSQDGKTNSVHFFPEQVADDPMPFQPSALRSSLRRQNEQTTPTSPVSINLAQSIYRANEHRSKEQDPGLQFFNSDRPYSEKSIDDLTAPPPPASLSKMKNLAKSIKSLFHKSKSDLDWDEDDDEEYDEEDEEEEERFDQFDTNKQFDNDLSIYQQSRDLNAATLNVVHLDQEPLADGHAPKAKKTLPPPKTAVERYNSKFSTMEPGEAAIAMANAPRRPRQSVVVPMLLQASKYESKTQIGGPMKMATRIITKSGNTNLSAQHLNRRSRRYLQDMFTTMVDIQWRYNLLVFAMGFVLSWFGFALIWWLLAFGHGDFDHLPDEEGWKPCVNNVNTFTSAFLFSIETQHTIGYGSRYTTEECPEAIFLMCFQSIFGVMIQCFMAGFVFAKLSRPQKRSQTLMFSYRCVVCMRDGRLCLMFRVGDLRDRSHIIGATVSAQIIKQKVSKEGEVMPFYHTDLKVRFDHVGPEVLLIWPAIIVHEIDENSPFYDVGCIY